MRRLLPIFVSIVLCVWAAVAYAAEPRTALVIGNAAYGMRALSNPVNDATDIAAALRQSGFEVILKTDADLAGMTEAVREFGAALQRKGGVGLFYFAGHGVQIGGDNYIIPVGVGLAGENDVRTHTVNSADVLNAMAAARNPLNIVILDACRDNPFSSGERGTRGLARMDSNSILFLSLSTSPGAVALDGDGRNSPYTKHLVRALNTPGLTIEDTFKRTLKGVYQETQGQQTPWISSSFFGEFVFRSGPAPPVVSAVAPTLAPAAPPFAAPAPAPVIAARPAQPDKSNTVLRQGPAPALAGLYRVAGTNPNGSRYSGMLTLTPRQGGYDFKWWIGRQVFAGSGQFAGRMLVVDWGQKHPVIYTMGGDRLNGEWADGSASEDLALFARAAETSVPLSAGRYRVAGRNPNGSRYTGTVSIAVQGGGYQLDWRVGSSGYRGSGTLAGNLLTVDWGSSTPVIYALGSDGRLTGLWDAGRGEEILTPER
jgi:Caspase domain